MLCGSLQGICRLWSHWIRHKARQSIHMRRQSLQSTWCVCVCVCIRWSHTSVCNSSGHSNFEGKHCLVPTLVTDGELSSMRILQVACGSSHTLFLNDLVCEYVFQQLQIAVLFTRVMYMQLVREIQGSLD